MLSLRSPPDFRSLEAAADRLTDNAASSLAPNRRRDPRRPVQGAVFAGLIPGPCERLTLGRIPVSVFKPVWGAWAVDLSATGIALVCNRRSAQAERWWLRLDDFATRPTILPAFVAGCRPLDTADQDPASGETLFRVRFKFQIASPELVQRLKLDGPEAVQHDENDLRLIDAVAA